MVETLYIDMDNVLVDFPSGIQRLPKSVALQYKDDLDEAPGIFALMDPLPGAIEAYKELSEKYETYILSTAPWKNPGAWKHKIQWVQEHLPKEAHKRLILSHNKQLNRGHYLIDDRPNNGAKDFKGEWIHFGSEKFPDWEAVLAYLL